MAKKPAEKPAKEKAEKEEEGEDFISKLKKMKSDTKSPSVIAETLEKLETLEKENTDLKEKIENDAEALKNVTKEKEDLGNKFSMKADEISELKRENYQLITENKAFRSKMEEIEAAAKDGDLSTASAMSKSLVEDLQKKLTKKKKQVSDLQNKVNTLESQINNLKEGKAPSQDVVEETPPVKEPETEKASSIDKGLLDELSAELTKKKTLVRDFEVKIKKLTEEKESLNKQLEELKRGQDTDQVVPVEETPPPAAKAKNPAIESKTLDILIQDLQSDLNKYKKAIVKLKKENADLKKVQGKGDATVDDKEIKALKAENKSLKDEIVNLEKKLMAKAKEAPSGGVDADKITELEDELKERDKIIKELKASKTAEAPAPGGGSMTGLVDDLQSKINKLKLALKEKNKIIDELQKEGKFTIKR